MSLNVAAVPAQPAVDFWPGGTGPLCSLCGWRNNPINQKVAKLMVRRLGHTAGSWTRPKSHDRGGANNASDAVLMDVEMLGHGRLTTTRTIFGPSELPEQPTDHRAHGQLSLAVDRDNAAAGNEPRRSSCCGLAAQ